MIFVILLRWIFGTIEFEVVGKFPEKFLNAASRQGINLWNMVGDKQSFRASARLSDRQKIEMIAQKQGNEIHTLKNHGLPYLVTKYKHRSGLLVGSVLFMVIYWVMSGFVWNIEVHAPSNLNEYEIKTQLHELGLAEGVWSGNLDTEKIERELSLKDNRISWVAVNLMGTDVEVNISSKIQQNQKERVDENTAVNIKSNADGTVTRMEVHKGKTLVHIGDGIHKGQLLVSGVVDYENGNSEFIQSEAKIYANTSRTVTFSIPKQKVHIQKTGKKIKRDLSVFGVKIPIWFGCQAEGNLIRQKSKTQGTLFDQKLPLYFSEEIIESYQTKGQFLSKQKAESMLKKQSELYDSFLTSSDKVSALQQKSEYLSENKKNYTLTVHYIVEEDVSEKSFVNVKNFTEKSHTASSQT